ncbi:P1 family peptidase [Nonomuraea typhae]|uniref:DmpA family aminopeptidase n=1 Tax=Nonomuraea typhae TaxID=2603600 RepID=UPI0012FA29B2|nr:P1 family peptidase [Nonomuraea typhae]
MRPRARALPISLDGATGAHNAITDVPGVEVGYVTLTEGTARTGVTAILPRGRDGVGTPCAAGVHSLNGNGEMTGVTWIEESGALTLPVTITNTHAVGTVHRGVIDWVADKHPALAEEWLLPVVAETWDGYLNDINAPHVRPEHAGQAIDAAAGGTPAEGSVGGGTGMNCYGFKGGSGTSSRVVEYVDRSYTVGAFVQANFGSRAELTVAGNRVGPALMDDNPMAARTREGAGSVIVVVATDAPLLPGQCKALARRVPLGLARTGTTGSHFSGDIFLAFSTANEGALTSGFAAGEDYEALRFVPWGRMDRFYDAVVQAVEEAVLNALTAAEDTVGRDGHRSPGLPLERLTDLLTRAS